MWDRIAGHDFQGGDGGGLTARVMQVTGWDGPHAEAAIEEYRRFIYLLAIVKTARRVAPKDVDRVCRFIGAMRPHMAGFARMC